MQEIEAPAKSAMGGTELSEWIVAPGWFRYIPEEEALPRKTSRPVVYVMDMIGTPYVKIGSTANIRARLVHMRAASPFDIVCAFAMVPSEGLSHIDVEKEAHESLAAHHVRGEWFELHFGVAARWVCKADAVLRKGLAK